MNIDISLLTLLLLVVLIALVSVAAAAAILFVIQRARLNPATRYADVEQRLIIAQEALERKHNEIREADQKIADRDRLAAEAAALREQIEELRAQLAGLEPARAEIAAALDEAAEAAAQREKNQAELIGSQEALEAAKRELEAVRHDLDPERIDRLKAEQAAAQSELDRIQKTLEPLRAERDAALRIVAEGNQQTARAEALKIEIERLDHEKHTLDTSLDTLRNENKELETGRQELARLRETCADAQHTLETAREREARFAARMESLQAEIAETTRLRDTAKHDLSDLKEELEGARSSLESAERDRENAIKARNDAQLLQEESRATRQELIDEARQLETRITLLKTDLKELLESMQLEVKGQKPIGPVTEAQRKALLSDLLASPTCLATPAQLQRNNDRDQITEATALHQVRTYLQSNKLKFSNRVLNAFHTSLKINDTAQITVLAGVSGTGKSLLPRRYAEAMGIHFLQVAVEPRWDSPQDLLGFYNYVEGKYRATELARLMASMDPWQSFGKDIPNHRDRLAMVLLDEMNLARVEYYFSEFLSRLEVRPSYHRGWADRSACKDALIPVDIRGLEDPPALFPGQNILFVGTMNDDESTQSLSDKVLDRGNVMQFPAPTSFPATGTAAPGADADALRFDTWRSWVRPPSALEGADGSKTADVVKALAEIMEDFGKPFGFRMNQSIRHYVANYPTETSRIDVDTALIDQIEFRILPKLRGIEISNFGVPFEKLDKLIGETLNDSVLARRLQQQREEQENRTGQFVWRGLARD